MSFFIQSSYRSQGYGHELMNYVKEKLKEVKITYIALGTSKLSNHAKAFFKKEGFDFKDYIGYDYMNK